MKYDTNHTSNIICPYCGFEDEDSWEQNDYMDGGCETEIQCSNCDNVFDCTMDVTITYSSTKKLCETHDYQHAHYFIKKQNYLGHDKWQKLSEHEYQYYQIKECSICDDTEYIEISKEEYMKDGLNE